MGGRLRLMAGGGAVLVAVLSPAGWVTGATTSNAATAAAGGGHLVSIVNGNATDKVTGGQFDAVQLTAPAACDPTATRHLTRIIAVHASRPADNAAAQQWVGENLYATTGVGLPGPLTVRSNGSWQQLADAYHRRLVAGTYEIELRCQDNLAQTIYQTWTGQLRFTSATRWTGFRSTGSAAASSSSSAAPTASTAVTAAPTAGDAGSPKASTTGSPRVGSSSSTSPSGASGAAGSGSPTGAASAPSPTPLTTALVADQPQRGSDPAGRKYLLLGAVALVVAGVWLLRSWRRNRPGPDLGEQR